jgi:hypothetical protein
MQLQLLEARMNGEPKPIASNMDASAFTVRSHTGDSDGFGSVVQKAPSASHAHQSAKRASESSAYSASPPASPPTSINKKRKSCTVTSPFLAQAQASAELMSLRTELEDSKRKNETLESDAKRYDEESRRQSRDTSRWKERYESTKQDLDTRNAAHKRSHQQASSFMCKWLTEQCERERTESSLALQRDCHDIGNITIQRSGPTLSEAWEEGAAFRALQVRSAKISQEREQYEGQQKQVKSKRNQASKAAAKAPSNDSAELMGPPSAILEYGPNTIQHFIEQEDVLRLRLDDLRKADSAISHERERLECRKLLHVRELKRQRDESHSQFNNCPKLGPPSAENYLLLNLLGKGGFSEVYRAFDLNKFQFVACKIHQLNNMWSEVKKVDYIKHATREYNIQKTLEHPRVVRLLDVFEIDINAFCTVLEYCDGTDLDQYVKEQSVLSEKQAKSIISQVFSGLRYLNEQKPSIIHYDLKPGNILYDRGQVKITDFGLSKIVDEDTLDSHGAIELTSQGAGTYWYLPPECFATGGHGMPPRITSKVDVWSAGVIFYQVRHNSRPSYTKLFVRSPSQMRSRVCRCFTAKSLSARTSARRRF